MIPSNRRSPIEPTLYNPQVYYPSIRRSPHMPDLNSPKLPKIEEDGSPHHNRWNVEIDDYNRRICEAEEAGYGESEVEFLTDCRDALRKARDSAEDKTEPKDTLFTSEERQRMAEIHNRIVERLEKHIDFNQRYDG